MSKSIEPPYKPPNYNRSNAPISKAKPLQETPVNKNLPRFNGFTYNPDAFGETLKNEPLKRDDSKPE